MRSKLRTHVAALMLLAPVGATFVAAPASAQHTVAAAPNIASLSFDADAGLSPGSTLRLHLQATPGARAASVVLGDSGIRVNLRERTRGNYVGSYVVRRVDRIDPTGHMIARVTHGQRTITRTISYPPAFQALAGSGSQAEAAPEIERFVMRPVAGRITTGTELRFRLRGQPGADAWVDIPGVIRGIDLQEVRPGLYEGSYTVRPRDNANAFPRAMATLQAGKQRTQARVVVRGEREEAPAAADRRGPQVTDLTPTDGQRVGPRAGVVVSARLSDDASGVDPASVRLRIDGRDVTAESRIDADSVRFRDDLNPGRHNAELVVQDRAGNSTRTAWSFDVAPRAAQESRELSLRVTSLRDGAVIAANGDLEIQGQTAPNATVRVQIESIANVGGVLGLSQPVADQTVRADRNGLFTLVVRPRTLGIPGTRFEIRLTANDGTKTVEERLTVRQG